MAKKLLYLTHSAGFRHDCLPYSHEVMQSVGRNSGAFDATTTDDCALLTRESLKGYDAVAFCTTGELPMSDDQKNALIDFVKSGKAFVGIHNATDTLYKFTPYGELIGGYFNGHPWHQEVGIIVEDKNHPATRDLGDYFKIVDEIYEQRDWSREKTRVLMRLDTATVDMAKPNIKRTDGDFAMAWCHPFGEGRVFYTGLGHSKEVWGDERFQKHLLGGIQWAMKQA